MTIKHHLNEPLTLSYAAGALPEAFELVVASHLALCPESRAQLNGYEAMGGALLQDCDQVAMADDAFAQCIDRIDAGPVVARTSKPPIDGVFPAPLQAYVGDHPDQIKWQRLGRGVKQAIIKTTGDATARLLYIPAGQAVPDHGHGGLELTLVLQGAFRDETNRFARGDIEIADQDLEHTPVAEMGADCICLAATDAPLRFNELMPRILQPLFRI